MTATPDIDAAAALVAAADRVIADGVEALRAAGGPDANQVVAYDLAHAASAAAAARVLLDYGALGETEAAIACAFAADVVHGLVSNVAGREHLWRSDAREFDAVRQALTAFRDPAFVAGLAESPGPQHLDADMELVQDTFRAFAAEVVAPHAERVHRTNDDVPEEVIDRLAELGAFGLSVPTTYGGYAEGGASEYLAMVVASEELSRASLGIGGSLITRPEILTRALLIGGTEEQKRRWLPRLASGELMAAVAVTEPDVGSDVANLTVAARRADGVDGAPGYTITGVKTWCTFAARADVLMLLARTDPDRSTAHRGLSLFLVPKPCADGHGFRFTDEGGGTLEGRPIDTIGYRGMHSYELAFDRWWVPAENLIGDDGGLGRGFYYQMAGFETGRLQTAARAIGVMQAAYDAAIDYARARRAFGTAIIDYPLTRTKLGRMVALIQAARQAAFHVAESMAQGGRRGSTQPSHGATEASMVKAYACRAAEWVTREAQQIHGAMGYAEEFAISRLFVDARVLSIFEGTDETLCLKVIAKRLVS